VASPVINDIEKVSWIATILPLPAVLPLPVVLSYPPTSITVGEAFVTTDGLSDQFPTVPLIHAPQAKKRTVHDRRRAWDPLRDARDRLPIHLFV
jgi:hypothetical protein